MSYSKWCQVPAGQANLFKFVFLQSGLWAQEGNYAVLWFEKNINIYGKVWHKSKSGLNPPPWPRPSREPAWSLLFQSVGIKRLEIRCWFLTGHIHKI